MTNEEFRAALIADPLRAVADAGDVTVSPEQLRLLEDMDAGERADLVADVVRDVYMKGAVARFGDLGLDGRLGGPDPPALDPDETA